MAKMIALAAFGIAFALFMALKYVSRHARTGVDAARRAADAIADGSGGGLHAHFHGHACAEDDED